MRTVPPDIYSTSTLNQPFGLIMPDLKKATELLHKSMEARLDIFNRCHTLAGYQTLLARFYGFYAPVEAALAAISGLDRTVLDLPVRAKTPWLQQDLANLGLRPEGIDTLPRCCNLPVLPTIAHGLGAMYVLEGATLGGQIILRYLKERPFYLANTGFRFFSSYGSAVGPRWKAFGAALESYSASLEAGSNTPDQSAIIMAACQTFEKLDLWLNGVNFN